MTKRYGIRRNDKEAQEHQKKYWSEPHPFLARGFNRCDNICFCSHGKEHPVHQVSK